MVCKISAGGNTRVCADEYQQPGRRLQVDELDAPSGLALFALYSKITDRAEPGESLKANTCLVSV